MPAMTCFLLFFDLDGAYQGLLDAVHKGEISEKRIDESVLKILRAKASVRLNHATKVDIDALSAIIVSPENLAFAQQVADASLTLVRENGHMFRSIVWGHYIRPCLRCYPERRKQAAVHHLYRRCAQ